tara:strand:+ start:445 stop:900 length:456 start_codon:yes stop_codon:yes gene_type:complete
MLTFIYILKFFHIMAASVWFGAVLLTPSDVRRTLDMGRPHVDGLAERLEKSVSISLRAGVLAVLTGFGLIFASGGMAAMHFRIHIGMTLGILMLGIGFLMIMPIVIGICDNIRQGGDLSEAKSLAPRLGMFSGINHLLWFITLALMVIHSF